MNDQHDLISPDRIGDWIPAATIAASRPGQWPGLGIQMQAHAPWQGHVPPLRDYLITSFSRPGRIGRQLDGPWQSEDFCEGDVTLLPRDCRSEWRWSETFENTHLHVGEHYLAGIAREVFGRDDPDVELVDRLRIPDPFIAAALGMLVAEARESGSGEQLFVDAVATQLCVHILRRYSAHALKPPRAAGSFSARDARRVSDHIEANLSKPISIQELAGIAGMSPFHFARQFKIGFGLSPHRYVMARRLEAAGRLMKEGDLELKQIAARCGFYDQSHMTRLFRQRFGVTPASTRLR